MTQIVMPYMTEGIAKHTPEYEAWRWAYFLARLPLHHHLLPHPHPSARYPMIPHHGLALNSRTAGD